MKRRKKKETINGGISAYSATQNPHTVDEMINFYGTYNIQPTSATENAFPAIAQGLASDFEKYSDGCNRYGHGDVLGELEE